MKRSSEATSAGPNSQTPLEPTGVPQLDLVLGGGLPRGALSIILGPPGSGKTTLVSQIAFAAARRGQRVLFLTALSEPTGKLLDHLRAFRFFDPNLIGDTIQVFSLQQFVQQGFSAMAQEIYAAARQADASFVIIDGFQGIRELESSTATRQLLYDLGTRLSVRGTTTLVTTESDPRDPTLFPEMTTGDVVIGLYFPLVGVRAFRGLEALKVRGRAPLLGRHSMALSDEGMAVFPRLEKQIKRLTPGATEAAPTSSERASFGLPELDALLSGGLTRQTSTLLAGSLGTGKTLLALQFALAGASNGEPTLLVSLRETIEQLKHKATTFGLGAQMQAALDSGKLALKRWEPVELDPGQVSTEMLATVERIGARRLIIDSIAELERAVTESSGAERVPNYLAALLAAIRARGVTMLAIKETARVVAAEVDFSADALSVLAENVLLLQQLLSHERLHRVLSVLKMRFSAHDHTLREFEITPARGFRVLSPSESGEDVLTRLARSEGMPTSGLTTKNDVKPSSRPTA
jgi:circadian clock protein KaiC